MKKIVEPPMVIMMDILVIFIFVFMLQEKPKVDIEFPETLYKNALVSYKSEKGYMVYKDNQWKILDYSTITDGLFLIFPCRDNLCKDYQTPNNEQKLLIIKNELFANIAKIYMVSSLSAKSSGSVYIYINKEGAVDFNKTYSKNKNLQHIKEYTKTHKNIQP